MWNTSLFQDISLYLRPFYTIDIHVYLRFWDRPLCHRLFYNSLETFLSLRHFSVSQTIHIVLSPFSLFDSFLSVWDVSWYLEPYCIIWHLFSQCKTFQFSSLCLGSFSLFTIFFYVSDLSLWIETICLRPYCLFETLFSGWAVSLCSRRLILSFWDFLAWHLFPLGPLSMLKPLSTGCPRMICIQNCKI